jgi:hypothetical protein
VPILRKSFPSADHTCIFRRAVRHSIQNKKKATSTCMPGHRNKQEHHHQRSLRIAQLYPSPTLPSPANEPRGQNTFDAVTTTVPSRRRTYQPRACYVIRKTESTESTFRNPKSSRQPPDPTFDHVPIHLVTSLEIEYTSRGYVMSSKAAMNRANEARLSWRLQSSVSNS